jgi:hypothetical protein
MGGFGNVCPTTQFIGHTMENHRARGNPKMAENRQEQEKSIILLFFDPKV